MTTTELSALSAQVTENEWGDHLAELVYCAASQLASSAINYGDEIDFLLRHGWTVSDIREALAEAAEQDSGAAQGQGLS